MQKSSKIVIFIKTIFLSISTTNSYLVHISKYFSFFFFFKSSTVLGFQKKQKIVILSLETIFFLHKILVLYETLTIWHPIYSACLNFVKVSLEYRNVFSRLILPEVIQVHDFTHHL